MDPGEKILSKILSMDQMDGWVAAEKAAGRRIGFTCGSFDLLHAGHVQYLGAAHALCDRLLVAVNSDASVSRYKNPLRPIVPERERMYVVAGLAAVDAVTLMEEDRPLSLLLRWKPDVYIKGGDYAEDSLRSADAVKEYGGKVAVVKSDFETSSSKLMERIGVLGAHAVPDSALSQGVQGLVLLDRDGTLIRNVPFLHDPAKVEILQGVIDGLLKLQAAGLRLTIISNQQGIGLGYYTVQDFIAVNQRLLRELGARGVRISKIYFCPHSLAEQCSCRKPATGMIVRAMRDFGVTPERTFVAGDSDEDMQAGADAGCQTVRMAEKGFGPAAEQILSLLRAVE
ncbi:MAG TPA: HAD-IIIA family hydrolase [Candidatus Limnocylindria bacterium]|nr:HAD-IIIA family hydrolase [Candidatus Limnocylindria bacterium]